MNQSGLDRRQVLSLALAAAALPASREALARKAQRTPMSLRYPLRLSANENPWGPGPQARAAIVAATDEGCRYGMDFQARLVEAVAAREKVDKSSIAIGSGSDVAKETGGIILVRSDVRDVDLGLIFGLGFPPSLNQEKEQAARSSLRELSDKLNSMPGVRAASFSAGAAPLQGEDDLYFWLDGQPKPANTSEMNMTLVYRVEPAYLAAMSIPLKQGRFFTAQDKEQTQPVAVIDEAFARQYFPNTDPIGKGIRLGDDDPALQIVGVVGHVKQWSLATEDQQSLQAQLYLPLRQLPGTPSRVSVVMRFEGEKAAAPSFDAVRRVVQTHHRENVVFGAQTLKEILAESLAAQRFAMILLEAFAAVALLLASIGLYGVISYLAGQRTHELGIRLALGAQRRDVLRLVLSDGMKPACGGVALGLIVALGLTRLLANLLYGVSATDPLTFAATAALLAAIALLACWLPARRATKVDPVVALRSE